ncbi:uracil-DNA glycosylase family protein [Sulfurovum sp.]|uniref:uracil-DNA glycosylase family protein n=1 Tax=Sulfurovum sp. TaxID=1969726 RepID=UPI0025D082FF|nr:uracil-DNA glycosylase family protein [Sulfurovum sp.]
MTFAKQILDFYFSLPREMALPNGVDTIYPFENTQTKELMQYFFYKYYDDTKPRTYLIGINPGRLGSGVTGVGFADAYHLEKYCGIPNSFDKRIEISASFMFEVIEAYGGVEKFYADFFFTTVMPLGLLKDGKNYNYYDDKETELALEPFITQTLLKQMSFPGAKPNIICVGTGKNLKYLQAFNQKHHCFESIEVVPHPRWVMQYRRKEKEKYIQNYLDVLRASHTL